MVMTKQQGGLFMATEFSSTKYTEEEFAALERKEMYPEEQVFCPRCGKELGFRLFGNSCEVKCPTKGCIKLTVRGI